MTIQTMTLERPRRELAPRPIESSSSDGINVLAAEPMNLRNLRDQQRLSGFLTLARANNMNAWKWFERIPEIHYALTRAARIAGYAQLKAVRYEPDGHTIAETVDSGLPADIVAGIYSRVGGVRGLLERGFLHMKIPAESHLLHWKAEGAGYDGYQFASSRELSDGRDESLGINIANEGRLGKLKMRTLPQITNVTSGVFETPIAQKDYLGRMWTPSPQWLDKPESPLEALDPHCDMLDAMTLNMSATLRSRFAVAGILYFHSAVREAFGGPQHKAKSGQTVLEIFYNIMKSNSEMVRDNRDVAAILPILMQGDAEVGKVAEHITIDREIFEMDLKLRQELIERILFGLDINAPSAKGNEDTSHWGAWQNSADELRLAVMPDLQGMCWAFDRLIMRRQLLESPQFKDTAGSYGVTFELDEASVRANRASDAREMRDKGALNIATLLQANGFRPEDAMDAEEYLRWLGLTLRIPRLGAYGYPEFDGLKDSTGKVIPWDDPTLQASKSGRIADGTGGKPKSEPGEGDPGSPDDTEDDTPKGDKPI